MFVLSMKEGGIELLAASFREKERLLYGSFTLQPAMVQCRADVPVVTNPLVSSWFRIDGKII